MFHVRSDDYALGARLMAAPAAEPALAARLRAEVAARLQQVCVAMAPDVFARAVDAIVARRLRWARRAAAERLAACAAGPTG